MTQRIDPGSDEVSVSEDSLMLDRAEVCWTGQRYDRAEVYSLLSSKHVMVVLLLCCTESLQLRTNL